ncbi:proline racemase [Pseudoalteromonas rubra]|uniref:trans-L-3-hydroxyproline dehydratase n=1 Tax=Pseudoalteromonas rubra TaxID=43658 RepID=A0A5S3WIT9_9GAMM|nr:proline racemase family protein [Pseudoalteromonas rubra]TMP26964.1 proline racemase [Pseudoalteromonas rubra]TMP27682.1 proline racemase [Pseudoalteromonas rubra]
MKSDLTQWHIPPHWQQVQALDMHTAGEPLRIILTGWPEPQGKSMVEKRLYCQAHFEELRRALMFEPRGHADMYGALLTEPERDDSAFGVLFMHNEGYSTMCGHAVIALTELARSLGPGVVEEQSLNMDTPAGQISAFYSSESQRVGFYNVPSFVCQLNVPVTLSPQCTVHCDIAFGGAYYAYVNADQLDLALIEQNYEEIITLGRKIKRTLSGVVELTHPEDPSLGFLYGVVFYSNSQVCGVDSHSRHVCIFADGSLDRSPTGTGVSGRAALLAVEGKLGPGEVVHIEGLLGCGFDTSIGETFQYYGHQAVRPKVMGEAYLTGKHIFCLDPSDPLKHGFILR